MQARRYLQVFTTKPWRLEVAGPKCRLESTVILISCSIAKHDVYIYSNIYTNIYNFLYNIYNLYNILKYSVYIYIRIITNALNFHRFSLLLGKGDGHGWAPSRCKGVLELHGRKGGSFNVGTWTKPSGNFMTFLTDLDIRNT